jgi:hypothetical protein
MKTSNQLRIPVVLPLLTESEPVSAAYSTVSVTSTGSFDSEGNLMRRFSWDVENTEREREREPEMCSRVDEPAGQGVRKTLQRHMGKVFFAELYNLVPRLVMCCT